MRSRYSAFVLKLAPYLLATWHPEHRPESLDFSDDRTQWLGLEVKRHQLETPTTATVEFVARYKLDGRGHRLHEISRFLRNGDQWLYVDGTFPESKSV